MLTCYSCHDFTPEAFAETFSSTKIIFNSDRHLSILPTLFAPAQNFDTACRESFSPDSTKADRLWQK